MGNYCRSPLACGLLGHALRQTEFRDKINIESAGLGDWHAGEGADERAFLVAENYGIDLSSHVARKITFEDFHEFDVILGMDLSNMEALNKIKPETTTAKIDLFLNFTAGQMEEISDPYMYGEEAFESVFGQLQQGTIKLIEKLKNGSLQI
jgi:protein-tyrosine phosphatase